jgi:hypothetical protein
MGSFDLSMITNGSLTVKLRAAMAVLGVLAFFGAVLPWVTASIAGFSASANGLSGGEDGWFTMLFGLAAGGLAVWSFLKGILVRQAMIASAAAGAIITLIAIIDFSDVSGAYVSVGFGLILTLIVGLGFIAAGALGLLKGDS